MFKSIECWVCGNDMNYLYDKETMTLEELQSLIQKEPC